MPSCAVLAWAAKRWSRARLLKIDILQDNAKELSQALACSKTNDLARLEEVCRWYVPVDGADTVCPEALV